MDRTMCTWAVVPWLYDAGLAVRLSQHLFNLQMARYRDQYPCIIFATNTTYTPPALPAHMEIKLEVVTGPPSDKQVESVQAALRLSENMANIPSMFDADLNMKLSQHLFDIQFERYLRQAAYGDSSVSMIAQAKPVNANNSEVANPLDMQEDDGEHNREPGDRGVSVMELASSGAAQKPAEVPCDPIPRPRTAARNMVELPEPVRLGLKENSVELLKLGLEDTTKLLVEIGAGLNDVKQILIVTQQSMARALNSVDYFGGSGDSFPHTLINAAGEEPHLSGLPSLPNLQYKLRYGNISIPDSDIARYLLFYGIGGELIQTGDRPEIIEGKRAAAIATLKSYLSV
ncbi:hypothetical protein FS749_012435 [Ceratobasidium sp. UAMH 11750]|nr:hypothetical protein FS749_012435 [Ceratobasidium sp. UAMH 11750]